MDATRRCWFWPSLYSAASARMAHEPPFAIRRRGRIPKNVTRSRRCACLTREVAPLATVYFEGGVKSITHCSTITRRLAIYLSIPDIPCNYCIRTQAHKHIPRKDKFLSGFVHENHWVLQVFHFRSRSVTGLLALFPEFIQSRIAIKATFPS